MTDREAMELARDLVRGSIIEDAASRFISQVLKEAHDSKIKPLRKRIEELEAQNELLQQMIANLPPPHPDNTLRNRLAQRRATLAELKGTTND